MKVSTKGRYAIRSLTHLAVSYRKNNNGPVSIKEISGKEKISNRYLENIFVKLRKKGIVNSVKGEKGGFKLSKAPDKVSLYDILISVENSTTPSLCAINPSSCDRGSICGIRKLWVGLDKEIVKYLTGNTLARATALHLGTKKGKK